VDIPLKKRPIVEIKDISCGYGRRMVLTGVNMRIDRGEFVGIIGPNGSGKTTLLRAISGFLPLVKGRITFEGRKREHIARREQAQKMAVVTQSSDQTPLFSVEEYVVLGRLPYRGSLQFMETTRDIVVAQRAMELTGITHLKGRMIGELSGGERQLVSVARAIAQEPRLLLLDEPTAHLDIGHQVQIMDLLQQLNRKHSVTIVMVVHDLTLASLSCERLVLLDRGRVRKIGRPTVVLTRKILEEVYKISVDIMETPLTGRPLILPALGKVV
jgi:iron complex transport system ATP-binding protein